MTNISWVASTVNNCFYCTLSNDDYSFCTSLLLTVYVNNNQYEWSVRVINWKGQYIVYKGHADNKEDAFTKAEQFGKSKLPTLVPDWVKPALRKDWNPPLIYKEIYINNNIDDA